MRSTNVLPFYMFVYMVCVRMYARILSMWVSGHTCACCSCVCLCICVSMCVHAWVCVGMRLLLRTFLDLTHLHPAHWVRLSQSSPKWLICPICLLWRCPTSIFWALESQAGHYTTWDSCGLWGPELQFLHLPGRCCIHWAVSAAPVCVTLTDEIRSAKRGHRCH